MPTPDQLAALALTDVREPIPAADLLPALGSSPFVHVPGTFNTRDLGLVPSPSSFTNQLRPGFAFRSGSLERLTPDGAALLAGRLGVRRIFDLRSQGERAAAPDPDVPGARNTWAPTEEKEATVELAAFVDGDGARGYADMYLDVLRVYRDPFRSVLEHIRDSPEEPFLFHCTALVLKTHSHHHHPPAGRDRTGVLSGLIASLAGQDPALVELDYLLSRVGTEPAREMLLGFLMKGSGAATTDDPGLHNLASLRPGSWRAFLAAVDREHLPGGGGGGGDGGDGLRAYARDALGFSEEELRLIAYNLSSGWAPPPPPANGA
ncbi:hypothetical protein RB598_004538 [Gaeumannomyces tritici]